MIEQSFGCAAFVGLLTIFSVPTMAQALQPQFAPIPQQSLLAVPAQNTLAPLHVAKLKSETPQARESKWRLFLPLTAGVYAAAFLDMHESVSRRPRFEERDPLAKPLTVLPAPGYYAAGSAFSSSMNWLGWKMSRSKHWHRFWWLPQVTSICGNVFGYVYTVKH